MLSEMTHVILVHRIFFKLYFSANSDYPFNPVDTAGELKRGCASVWVGTRTYPNGRALWLVLAMGALPVMSAY